MAIRVLPSTKGAIRLPSRRLEVRNDRESNPLSQRRCNLGFDIRVKFTVTTQGKLFSWEEPLPEGFVYQANFLSEREEAELLRAIAGESFETFDFHGYAAKRRSVEYGMEYDFATRKATATKPFPDFLLPLRERAAAFGGIAANTVVEGMVLEYPPGAPIGWHRDAPQFGIVIGISLLNAARLRLRRYRQGGKILSVMLEPRSMYILRGAARWQWQHSIPPMEKLRYSITFRTLRENEERKRA